MLHLLRIQRTASRPRRALRPTIATIEMLEDRTLLSSAAVIEWSMAPRIALDPAHGNEPDLPNTSAYANPPSGYEVLLNASQSVGILPTTNFSWTVTYPNGQTTRLSGENPNIDLPQASYQVQLTATGLSGTSAPVSTSTSIQVKDILIVAIGDSYASGEGNPVVPGVLDPEWAYSPDAAMNLENANAHRSTIAAPAQFALELQEANPHEAVTFVSVANSGASIPVGVLGPMPSIGDSSYKLPAEITELKQIIGTQHIDVLTVTVGGDDIHFATLVEDLIDNTYYGDPSLKRILKDYNTSLKQVPQHFAELASALQGLDPGQVLITQYPDITRNQNGKVAEIYGPLGIPLISKADAQFASQRILPPLNADIASAAKKYHWTLVSGFTTDFLTHGYPSTASWIRSVGQSIAMEGDDDGSFHPNAAGQLDIANYFLAAYMANLTLSEARS